MVINREIKTPLYEQLKLILQDKILLGEMGPGVLLPTEQQLCKQYSISRITVRNALDKLERNGLIERIQGRGSIVKKRELKKSHSEVQGYTKSMLLQGIKPRSELLEKNLVVGNPNLVELFHLPLNITHHFWHFRRLRYIADDPVVIMNHYVRKELGDLMLNYELRNASFYSLFEKILNRQLHDSEGLITAVQASPENAKLLNVEVGAALVWYRGITHLEGNVTVEVNYSLFVGDKFQFEMRMYKPRKVNIDQEQELVAIAKH